MKTFKLFVVLILITGLSENIAKADFVFGEPSIVPNLSGPYSDGSPRISRDGLEFYLNYNEVQGECSADIWVSTRLTINDPLPLPIKLEPLVNSSGSERTPSLSADGLELYFSDGYPNLTSCTPNPDGYGHTDLWVATRASRDDPWGGSEESWTDNQQ